MKNKSLHILQKIKDTLCCNFLTCLILVFQNASFKNKIFFNNMHKNNNFAIFLLFEFNSLFFFFSFVGLLSK